MEGTAAITEDNETRRLRGGPKEQIKGLKSVLRQISKEIGGLKGDGKKVQSYYFSEDRSYEKLSNKEKVQELKREVKHARTLLRDARNEVKFDKKINKPKARYSGKGGGGMYSPSKPLKDQSLLSMAKKRQM
jgi:hypothetical protein